MIIIITIILFGVHAQELFFLEYTRVIVIQQIQIE